MNGFYYRLANVMGSDDESDESKKTHEQGDCMKQTKLWAVLVLATALLAACGGQPETKAAPAQPAAKVEVAAPVQAAAPTEAPKAAAQPAAEVAGASKTVAKPVFIDFYAPW
jgi:thiol:disulfide interchange protein